MFCAALNANSPAAALTQSWNGYHWARTGPLVIGIGDNVGSAWDTYFRSAATQWTAANNIAFVVNAGKTTATACNAVYGGVQVCNANYGSTGWLGYATVWTSAGFIVQATVKMNEYYFSQAKYNTSAWRSMTMCQEMGHTLGLAHTDTVRTDLNSGSCMDYTNDPTGTRGTNGTLANTRPNSVDYNALNGIYATLNTTQLAYTKPTYWSGEGYSIDGVEVDSGGSLVPEPAVWMTLIAGFGLIGTAMRQRRIAAAPIGTFAYGIFT
jgi:hypothetical protein